MENVPRPLPFSAFEWLLSGRYLRARRKEGFIPVTAGCSMISASVTSAARRGSA